jgi:annexin A7/11
VKDLKSELGGKFEDVIVALMLPPVQYLCKQLRKAMDGIGTEEHALIEILCPMSNEQVKALIPCYEDSNLRNRLF